MSVASSVYAGKSAPGLASAPDSLHLEHGGPALGLGLLVAAGTPRGGWRCCSCCIPCWKGGQRPHSNAWVSLRGTQRPYNQPFVKSVAPMQTASLCCSVLVCETECWGHLPRGLPIVEPLPGQAARGQSHLHLFMRSCVLQCIYVELM